MWKVQFCISYNSITTITKLLKNILPHCDYHKGVIRDTVRSHQLSHREVC
uniref:Uncharacterized protein n=1 Tax=Anguilla anguilla TaxID=7936 RepID=A0A0E9T4P0_ANGAN